MSAPQWYAWRRAVAPPGQTVYEPLIFAAPRGGAAPLYLTLPGKTLGQSGCAHFVVQSIQHVAANRPGEGQPKDHALPAGPGGIPTRVVVRGPHGVHVRYFPPGQAVFIGPHGAPPLVANPQARPGAPTEPASFPLANRFTGDGISAAPGRSARTPLNFLLRRWRWTDAPGH